MTPLCIVCQTHPATVDYHYNGPSQGEPRVDKVCRPCSALAPYRGLR